MAKKILFLFIILITGAILLNLKNSSDLIKSKLVKVSKKSVVSSPNPVEISKEAVFVPYWTLNNEESQIASGEKDRLIYFGIAVNKEGIQKDEAGYQNIDAFVQIAGEKSKYIAVRMLNTEDNLYILENKNAQEKIAEDIVFSAREYGFSGVLLDLELSGVLPIDEKLPQKINAFVDLLSQKIRQENLFFGIAIYGDAFYRKRPFDVSHISSKSDEIMIMAYDFHKSGGEPGPNFPLNGKNKWGYDFTTMIDDFTRIVPREKLTVVFGMYGYDWIVDEKKRPIKPAQALSLNQIEEKYLNNCAKTNCVVFRDTKLSKENEIDYIDGSEYHIIWYEDERSAGEKIRFLKDKGVGSVAYWAFSYY